MLLVHTQKMKNFRGVVAIATAITPKFYNECVANITVNRLRHMKSVHKLCQGV